MEGLKSESGGDDEDEHPWFKAESEEDEPSKDEQIQSLWLEIEQLA